MKIVNCVALTSIANQVETFKRHLPLYKKLPGFLVVTCPFDKAVDLSLPTIRAGMSSHIGVIAVKRVLDQFRSLIECDADWYVYFEYDSFCLDPCVPDICFEKNGIWANELIVPDKEYKAQTYGGLPWVIDNDTLCKLVEIQDKTDLTLENAVQDRLMYWLIYEHHVPYHWYNNLGFSSGLCCPQEADTYAKAIMNGAVMIHGVKDQWGYDFVMKEREVYLQKQMQFV